MPPDNKQEVTVSFRVFLPESLRTEFKVWCARENTNMSEKTRSLIEQWIETKVKANDSKPA
ncbi:hypothetical protein [Nostoc sphaeroides]|uniref:hypothetical protein n=1 Tax=Nostoc sphaeroides TaxID=446679 RepID=UPI000E503212|nr:hypothetical protein [Nostoc sphaeroides]